MAQRASALVWLGTRTRDQRTASPRSGRRPAISSLSTNPRSSPTIRSPRPATSSVTARTTNKPRRQAALATATRERSGTQPATTPQPCACARTRGRLVLRHGGSRDSALLGQRGASRGKIRYRIREEQWPGVVDAAVANRSRRPAAAHDCSPSVAITAIRRAVIAFVTEAWCRRRVWLLLLGELSGVCRDR